MTKPARRYGGIALEERQAERRDRLVKAAVDVAARAGMEGATIAAICAEAGLTARYFYESFSNRDALFVEAYRLVQNELFARMVAASPGGDAVRGALIGFFTVLAANPGAARVFLLDFDERDPATKAVGRAGGQKIASIFAPGAEAPLAQVGVAGAIVQIARRWIESGFAESPEAVAAQALPFARAGTEASAARTKVTAPKKKS